MKRFFAFLIALAMAFCLFTACGTQKESYSSNTYDWQGVVTEEVAFGEPTQRTYVNSEKMFRITGGNEPYDESNPEAYSNEDVHKLVDAYKAYCAERLEAAKNATAEDSAPADAQKTAMQSAIRTSSLI